jgi:HEAT repeat protein
MWIAAALDDESLAPHVLPALSSPDPVVRRAAAWSLGEAATGDAVARALERAARADGDEIVRRLAAGALAKHAGTAPRVLGAAPAG